jgi:hypothetical protein
MDSMKLLTRKEEEVKLKKPKVVDDTTAVLNYKN